MKVLSLRKIPIWRIPIRKHLRNFYSRLMVLKEFWILFRLKRKLLNLFKSLGILFATGIIVWTLTTFLADKLNTENIFNYISLLLLCNGVSQILIFSFKNINILFDKKRLVEKVKTTLSEKSTLENVVVTFFNIAFLCYIRNSFKPSLDNNDLYSVLTFIFFMTVISVINRKILKYIYKRIINWKDTS